MDSRPCPFFLNGAAGYAIGIEIGWQHSDFVLVDLAGNVTRGRRITYPFPHPDRLVEDTIGAIEELRATLPRDARVLGVARTGPAGLAERVFVLGASPEESARLAEIDLAAEIMARTGLTVTTSNDGAAALLAETRYGRVPRNRDCAYVFLSTFVGSALHLEGHVLGTTGDSTAKIGGAMTRHPDGSIHALHFSASLWALASHLIARGHAIAPHDLDSWDWQDLESDLAEWLDRAAEDLALVFANTAAIAGVPIIVVDGVLPRPLIARMINTIQARISAFPIAVFEAPYVLLGQAGASAPAIGAAHQLFHALYFEI